MKWVFFVLLGLNIALLGFHWLQQRDKVVPAEYTEEGVNRITLLSEVLDKDQLDARERCLLIGPFKERLIPDAIVKDLKASSLTSSLIVQDVALAPSYRLVYRDKEERPVELVQKEFREKGFDSFVIAEGEFKGQVSLGVFENVDLSRRLKKKISKLGYELHIHEEIQSVPEFWVQLSMQKSLIYKEKVAEIAASLDNDKKMREIFCKSVASENQFP